MRDFLQYMYTTEWYRFFDAFGSRMLVYGMLIAILRNVWRGGNRYTRKTDVASVFQRADMAENVLRFIGWKQDNAGMWQGPPRYPAGWIAADGSTQTGPDEIHNRPFYLE